MTLKRQTYSDGDVVALTSEVESVCPLCGSALFYEKRGRMQKLFELAHIYPLNPSVEEVVELDGVELLHEDVNHPMNLIALCRPCHTKFDKPRTRAEYQSLVSLKRMLLRRAEQKQLQAEHRIEVDINRVISGLHMQAPDSGDADLEYDPKRLDQKFDASMPIPTRQKIRHGVADYYQYIRIKFVEIERESPTTSQLIYSQVHTYYLQQKRLGLSQAEVFGNIVDWLEAKTKPDSIEAAELVASFFVQNCEVFE